MPGEDETNELLREIRDLLAQREEQYRQHLADIRKVYAEQLKMGDAERAKAIRTLSILGAVIAAAATMIVVALR